ATLVRLIPSIRARAASTRWPARPSGTGRARRSAIGGGPLLAVLRSRLAVLPGRLTGLCGLCLLVLGSRDVLALGGFAVLLDGRGTTPVHADATEGEHRDPDRGEHDRDVGHVAHEPAVVVDEVHHVPHGEARFPEEPVAEVAERPAEQRAECHRPAA